MFDTYSERFTLDNEEIENALRTYRAGLAKTEDNEKRAACIDYLLDYADKNFEFPPRMVERLGRYAHARYVMRRFFCFAAYLGPIAKACRNAEDDALDLFFASLPEEFDRRHGSVLISAVGCYVADCLGNETHNDPEYINFAKL